MFGRPTHARHRRRSVASAFLACLAIVAFGAPAPAAAASPTDTLGVYAGAADTIRLASFETRLGRPVQRVHDYLDKRSWTAINDTSWMLGKWSAAGFDGRLVLTVPMIPDSGGTLAQGAAGTYNAHFRTLAENLVARGHGSAVLRLGPEFNGVWFGWTINVPDGGPLFAAYWRQIVGTMRAVPGANFTFDWCPNNGSSWVAGGQLEAEGAYPGDAYVDYIGMDVYDQSWIPLRSDPAARWSGYVNMRNGLAWHAAFAAAHGKPMTFPEWGLAERSDGFGGGDSPYFIEQMHAWIASHPVAYHLYFEYADANAEYAVFSGRFPNAAATFVRYFGSGGPPSAGVETAPAASGTGAVAGWGGGATKDAGGAPRETGDGPAATGAEPAQLTIARARILPSGRLDVLAPISSRASGTATVELKAGGRVARFVTTIDRRRDAIRLRTAIARRQARAGTGIVTIRYAGNGETRAQVVRLRVAPRRAGLVAQRPKLVAGWLRASGAISRRARGTVRVELAYSVRGRERTRRFSAPIAAGRWRVDAALPAGVREEIAARDGIVFSTATYGGHLPARLGGAMRSFELLGAR